MEPLNKLLRSASCAPAVLGILMYWRVHCGSCAPAARNLPSLATLLQRFLELTENITHRGGCHCGRVRFEVNAPERPQVQECTCSICRMTGFVHLIVPSARFRLLSGDDALTEYRFNTGIARHLFCKHCGVKSFYVPRSHPHGYSINARCLDGDVLASCTWLPPFDDANREAATAAIAHLADDD